MIILGEYTVHFTRIVPFRKLLYVI